jgi:hypothetical protein
LAIANQDLDLFNEQGWQSNQLATVIENVMAQFRHTFRRWIIWHSKIYSYRIPYTQIEVAKIEKEAGIDLSQLMGAKTPK